MEEVRTCQNCGRSFLAADLQLKADPAAVVCSSCHTQTQITTLAASPEISLNNWYVAIDQQPRGPLTQETLLAYITMGMLKPTTLVWQEPMPEWVTAQSVPAFVRFWAPVPTHSQQPLLPPQPLSVATVPQNVAAEITLEATKMTPKAAEMTPETVEVVPVPTTAQLQQAAQEIALEEDDDDFAAEFTPELTEIGQDDGNYTMSSLPAEEAVEIADLSVLQNTPTTPETTQIIRAKKQPAVTPIFKAVTGHSEQGSDAEIHLYTVASATDLDDELRAEARRGFSSTPRWLWWVMLLLLMVGGVGVAAWYGRSFVVPSRTIIKVIKQQMQRIVSFVNPPVNPSVTSKLPSPTIDHQILVEVARRHAATTLPCLDQARRHNVINSGDLTLRLDFLVKANGGTENVALVSPQKLVGSQFAVCIQDAVNTWQFPPLGHDVPVRHFRFGPIKIP